MARCNSASDSLAESIVLRGLVGDCVGLLLEWRKSVWGTAGDAPLQGAALGRDAPLGARSTRAGLGRRKKGILLGTAGAPNRGFWAWPACHGAFVSASDSVAESIVLFRDCASLALREWRRSGRRRAFTGAPRSVGMPCWAPGRRALCRATSSSKKESFLAPDNNRRAVAEPSKKGSFEPVAPCQSAVATDLSPSPQK